MLRIINIKEGYPNSEYAVYLLDCEINVAKMCGDHAILVIHGYGSHGVGGVIRNAVHEYLQKEKHNKNIIDFVPGDNWIDSNEVVKKICSAEAECIVNQHLLTPNSGITVVYL